MAKIQDLRNDLEQQKGRRQQIVSAITQAQASVKQLKKDLADHEQARTVIKHVGLKTQQLLQYHIGEITSLAMEAVFDDPYEMIAEFVERRNKTECDLLFERDGKRINPLDASGGGVVDIASFALRAASWSMGRPRTQPVLILDEPFKQLSANLMPKASQMLEDVSKELGLQIIMVTHSDELTERADKIFEVRISKRKSIVKEV